VTRHRPHPVLSSLLALSLLADTAMAAHIAWYSTAVGTWLTASVLAYVAMLAALWALVTVRHAARVAPYRRARKALYRPTGRPRPGTGGRPAAPVDGRHARAQAAPPAHDGLTQPMPVIDLAAFDYEYSGGAR
jgi:hypothetical protein